MQVPPGLRWEIGSDDPFGHHLEEITHTRLRSKFRVINVLQLSDEQRQYASDYHRAMVEPFTDNRSWYRLLRAADASWPRVFKLFENLAEISVGTCEIVDHPAPTYTHTFVLQHGRDVINEPNPMYVQDRTVNKSWASSVVLKAAPPSVRTLRLSLANLDNFSSFATVNRLLTLGYRQPPGRGLSQITRLCLMLEGIKGTHGSEDHHGETASAGVVRHWKVMLNSVKTLQHLELKNALKMSELSFSPQNLTDGLGCILDWILPDLILPQLRTLRLTEFVLDENIVPKTFAAEWPQLEYITFDDVKLMKRKKEEVLFEEGHAQHLLGKSWVTVCNAIFQRHQHAHLALNRPVSVLNDGMDHVLHPSSIRELRSMPNVELDVRPPYLGFTVQIDDDGEEFPSTSSVPVLPDAPTTALV